MAVFYVDSPSEGIIELTATTDIQVDERSTPSKHKLETGETITDNVTVDNVNVTFSGVITEARVVTRSKSQSDGKQENRYSDPVQGIISSLRRIKNSKELFTVRYDNRFPAFNNCVLTTLSIVRDASSGLGYRVTLSFEQVRISGRAAFFVTRSQEASPDTTQEKTESGSNNQEQVRVLTTSGLNAVNASIYTKDSFYVAGENNSVELQFVEEEVTE